MKVDNMLGQGVLNQFEFGNQLNKTLFKAGTHIHLIQVELFVERAHQIPLTILQVTPNQHRGRFVVEWHVRGYVSAGAAS